MPRLLKGKIENGACEIECVHPDVVQAARQSLPQDETINALAETFRTLSDPTRIRIVTALTKNTLCVCDLATMLGLTGSAVSHQLRVLRGQRLVSYRKEGKIAYYTLDDDHIGNLLNEGLRHVRGE